MLDLPGHDPINDDDLGYTLTPGTKRRGIAKSADLPAEYRDAAHTTFLVGRIWRDGEWRLVAVRLATALLTAREVLAWNAARSWGEFWSLLGPMMVEGYRRKLARYAVYESFQDFLECKGMHEGLETLAGRWSNYRTLRPLRKRPPLDDDPFGISERDFAREILQVREPDLPAVCACEVPREIGKSLGFYRQRDDGEKLDFVCDDDTRKALIDALTAQGFRVKVDPQLMKSASGEVCMDLPITRLTDILADQRPASECSIMKPEHLDWDEWTGTREDDIDRMPIQRQVSDPLYEPCVSGLQGPTEIVAGKHEKIFEVWRPYEAKRLPVIVHVPHAGTLIPDDVRETFVASRETLAWDLERSTDHAVDELWEDAIDHGATLVTNRVSRLVCDVERFTDDMRERPMTDVGRGVVYLKTGDGLPLRTADFAHEEVVELTRRIWGPWHELMGNEVERMLADFGVCYIIDAHSFPERPLACETIQDTATRPDICLGWDDYHVPYQRQGPFVRVFQQAGLAVGVNQPFRGSFVPSRFHEDDSRVLSAMVEVNRRLYLDEAEVEFDPEKAELVQRCLWEMLDMVGDHWPDD